MTIWIEELHPERTARYESAKPKAQREQAAKLFSILIEIEEYSQQHGPDVEIPEQLKEKERYLRRIREAEERLLSELQERKNQKNLKEPPDGNNL